MTAVDPSDRVVALAAAGRKIEAIKLLRDEHGLGLREAKEIVDRLPRAGGEPRASRIPSAGREERHMPRLLAIVVVLAVLIGAFYLS